MRALTRGEFDALIYRLDSVNSTLAAMQAEIDAVEEDVAGLGGGGGIDEALSVIDYGAEGDGVADDSIAIALAIDAAVSGGKRLHFPKGTYLISSVLTIDATDGIEITGRGANVRYSSSHVSGTRHAFSFTSNSTQVKVRGLNFQGDANDDKDVNAGVALYFASGATDIDIEGCRFVHCRPAQTASDYSTTGRLSFRNNRVRNAPLPVSTCQYSIIEGNWFICDAVVDTRAQAIYLFGPMEGCLISNNVFKNIAGQDIQIRASTARYEQKFGFVIADNIFENSAQYSVWIGSDTTLKAGGYTVTGNVHKNCTSAIFTQGLQESIIADNVGFWDWEYRGARSVGLGIAAIASVFGGSIAQRYGNAKSVIIKDNLLINRHPFFAIVQFDTVPTDGDTVTIGAVTYTWRDVPSTTNEIEIIPGDIPDCMGILQNAILGRGSDYVTTPNPVITDAGDVFYNQYVSLGGEADQLIVASNAAFAVSATGTAIDILDEDGAAITDAVDNRTGCDTGITVANAICPVVEGNFTGDFKAAATITDSYCPIYKSNVNKGGSVIYGVGNFASEYIDNEVVAFDQQNYQIYRNFLVKDGFPTFEGNDMVCEQEYTTPELMGAVYNVTVGTGHGRTFLWYGSDAYGDGDTNTIPFSWRDGDAVEFRGTGLTNLDCVFKRTAPGAGEFNSRATLMDLINASTHWSGSAAYWTDVGGSTDPGLMIQLSLKNLSGPADARVHVTTRALTCGQVLTDRYNDGVTHNADGSVTRVAYFLGQAAGATKTAIFSRRASSQFVPFVAGTSSGSYGLAPRVYQSSIKAGYGGEIEHLEATGAVTGSQFTVYWPSQ